MSNSSSSAETRSVSLLPEIFRSRKPSSVHTEVVLRWLLAHSG
jgi:hypothetical protein